MRIPAMVTVLALACSGIGAAQSAQRGAFFGGGFEAVGVGADYERAYGLSLQGGHVWQFRRVGVRLGATYFQRNREIFTFGYYATRSRAVGITGELTYDLTGTRFRPYVVGGWGVYRLWSASFSGSETRVLDQVSPTMIAGLGFRYRIRGAEVFSEARLHGLASGRWGAFMPVTFGVRFD